MTYFNSVMLAIVFSLVMLGMLVLVWWAFAVMPFSVVVLVISIIVSVLVAWFVIWIWQALVLDW